MSSYFWRVASYGYPNPFGDKNAIFSWEILQSFVQRNSYAEVKAYWQSPTAQRKLDHAAVESRKASFEEFGILYVLSGTDDIIITAGGRQLLDAAHREDIREFVWVAINLLLRYPLCGPPRRTKSVTRQPNFPVYWFLWAALFDLEDHLYWPELERVLCTVKNHEEAVAAVAAVRSLRNGERSLPPLPVKNVQGAFYNSLNQVIVHAGLYYELLDKAQVDDPYTAPETKVRRHNVVKDHADIVRLALGGGAAQVDMDCSVPGQFVSRMPSPPIFEAGEEQEYFEYIGAAVTHLEEAHQETSVELPSLPLGMDSVAVLTEGVHYRSVTTNRIDGDISTLCRIARKQRIILSHDFDFTYRVKDKVRTPEGKIRLEVARSKPITSPEPIFPYIIEVD